MLVPAGEVEAARARVLAVAPEGFEELESGDCVELAVYGGREHGEHLSGLFANVVSEPVEDGWEDRWRAFHRPTTAGGLWIGPPWESPPSAESAVVVDPGRAFGTGAHPTTRLCIELLSKAERGRLLDAGCGSGVLAVAAARLGFSPIVAVDVDPDSVEIARETARRNAVDIDVRRADAARDPVPAVDLVVANIGLQIVEAVLVRRLSGRAITSGYLAHEAPRVQGWERLERIELDGWVADALRAS